MCCNDRYCGQKKMGFRARQILGSHPALPLTCFWFGASYFLIGKIVINTHAPFQGCWENYVRWWMGKWSHKASCLAHCSYSITTNTFPTAFFVSVSRQHSLGIFVQPVWISMTVLAPLLCSSHPHSWHEGHCHVSHLLPHNVPTVSPVLPVWWPHPKRKWG